MSLSGARPPGPPPPPPVPTDEAGFSKLITIFKEYYYNKDENTPKQQLGPFTTDVSVFKAPPATGLRITLIGHSSLLIEIDGKRILTDPVWSDRVSFLSFMGPKRFFQPPLALEDLPKLDAVLLSHDHYDHLDKNTINFFKGKNIPFYCSLGVGKYLKRWGPDADFITEMDWGDSVLI